MKQATARNRKTRLGRADLDYLKSNGIKTFSALKNALKSPSLRFAISLGASSDLEYIAKDIGIEVSL